MLTVLFRYFEREAGAAVRQYPAAIGIGASCN
jgi:hypothetical protein